MIDPYPSRFTTAVYPIKRHDSILLKPDLSSPLSMVVYDLEVRLGLTPKMPTEENKPLLNVELFKKSVSHEGVCHVKFGITYTYRLEIDDSIIPTTEEIFNVLAYSAQDFSEKFDKFVENTIYIRSRVDLPTLEKWKKDIDRSIDFWQDSIRNLKVDKDGRQI